MLFRSIILLYLLAVTLLTNSCTNTTDAANTSDEGRIIIEFWHGMGSRHSKNLNEIADLYNQSQTKYQVRPIYQGRYNSLSQKLIASAYAGKTPALSQMYPGWTTRFYEYGYLEPVSTFIAKDPDFGTEDIQDFYPVMIDENTLKNPNTGEKELVTLPFNKSVYVLYVNQSLMEELGWKTAPSDWKGFLELSKAMTKIVGGDGGEIVRYGIGSQPFIENLTVMSFSNDIQLFDEETETIQLMSEENLEALKFLDRVIKADNTLERGYVETGYMNSPLGSGKIGMFIGSTASFPYNDIAVGNKFVWNAYAIPSSSESGGRTLMQGTNIGIFNSVSDEEKQGAWEFLKFLTNTEMTIKWATSTGYMPVRKSAHSVPEFQSYLEDNQRYANAVETLDAAWFEPRKMYWESIRSIVSRELEAYLLGRKGAEQAMQDATETIKEAMAQPG